MIRALQSVIYGSTEQYLGNVYVHANIEGISRISGACVSSFENYLRSMPMEGTSSLVPQIDAEMQRDASGIVSPTCTKIFTNDTASSGTCIAVLRSPNYLYYFNPSQTNPSLTEYSLADGTKTTVQVYTGTKPIYPQYGVLGERQCVMVGPGSDSDHTGLYLIDFEAGTSTRVADFLTYETGPGVDELHMLSYQYLNVVNYNDKLYSVISGDYSWYDGDAVDTQGCFFAIYNHTDDIETVTKKLHVSSAPYPDMIGDNSYYCSPVFVDGKFVLIPTTNWRYTGHDPAVPFHILDLDDLTQTVVLAQAQGTSPYYNETLYVYLAGPDHTNKAVLAEVYYYTNNGNTLSVIKLDLESNTPSLVQEDTNMGYGLCVGNTETYIYRHDNDKWYSTGMVETLTVTGGANGYNNTDSLSYAFDDVNERIWHYDASGPKLVGVRTDGNIREVSITVSDAIESPYRTPLFLLGDLFILAVMKSATGTTDYYMIRQEA